MTNKTELNVKESMKNKWYGSVVKGIFARQLALALVVAFGFGGAAAHAQKTPQRSPARLDAPVTPANSVLVDFGDGAILRVPKTLIDPTLITKDSKQPIKQDQISMVFQYPDMTETVYPSDMGLIFEMQAGRHKRTPDRFPVHVKWLFHSHEVFGPDWAARDASKGPEWRPVTLLQMVVANVREDAKLHDVSDDKITFSDYEGLREIHVPITDPYHHDEAVKAAKKRGVDWDKASGKNYVEQLGSPYELFMHCDDPSSLKCKADVYIKRNHFQYQMIFPPEAVAHTDELIRTVNKMIDRWVKK